MFVKWATNWHEKDTDRLQVNRGKLSTALQLTSMAVSLLSLVATVLLVCGFISNNSSWTLDGKEYDRSGHPHPAPQPSFGANPRPMNSMPPLMYHYQYPVPLKYYVRRKVPQGSAFQRRQMFDEQSPPEPRGYELASGYGTQQEGFGLGLERGSDFYYILPILLVIGLGSFLIPIISTFFTAMVTSQGAIGGCCGRRRRRNGEPVKPIAASLDTFWDILNQSLNIDQSLNSTLYSD